MYVTDGIVLVRRLKLDEKWSFAAGDQHCNKDENHGCVFYVRTQVKLASLTTDDLLLLK